MQKLTNLIFLISGLALFSSCEKETVFSYHLDNQSSYKVFIQGKDVIHSLPINDSINTDAKKEVVSWSKRGKQTEILQPKMILGSDLIIANTLGDTLTKNYRIFDNWTYEINDNRSVAVHKYILTITNEDF